MANVGSPLTKTLNYAWDGTLTSQGDNAREALNMNAQCSYWISACDRLLKQMYGSGNAGKGLMWVWPLVAKQESIFHCCGCNRTCAAVGRTARQTTIIGRL